MKLRALAAFSLTLLAAVLPAYAGPVFDDYLNYVRPGIATGPGKAQVAVTSSQPVGQSFALPDNTGEVYRIAVRPVYDTWTDGEKVTMSLYDSPAKARKLGEYAIDHATCRVQDRVTGNGSSFKESRDFALYFQFRKKTEGTRRLYFELTTAGGDGSVAFLGFDTDAYADGELSPAGTVRDLAFDVDIKPVPDKERHLEEFFSQRLNLDHPPLAKVKAAVQAREWERAIRELVAHFHTRTDYWWGEDNFFEQYSRPRTDPIDDSARQAIDTADLMLKGFLRHADTGDPIPWRKESYWACAYPAKQWHHAVYPDLHRWEAYTKVYLPAYRATGDARYARGAIDHFVQFVLDNPSPKTSGLPWYFEVWHDRKAASRAGGYGGWFYAYLYNFRDFSDDEKLILFSFFEDNAQWDYKATSGANWGAEVARACIDFGLQFPEWKMSPEYAKWGVARLAEISFEAIEPDGVSHESAIKYHAMVARRLKEMLRKQAEGKVEIEPDLLRRLYAVMERMYDHMAYTLQPDNRVVMYGDSWYEDFSAEVADTGRMIERPDLVWIATQGREGTPPAQVSKGYPVGGYYIMRSDFGENPMSGSSKSRTAPDRDAKLFADARQMLIHNGNWSGSHCHWDILSLNLYGFGRTLVIDPGQYDFVPPEGIDRYYVSRIHSLMLLEDRDMKREAGPSVWVTNGSIDYFDGKHFGYKHLGNVDSVRRRVAFVKPDYFLVDDSAQTTRDSVWTQVWNLTDPNATVDPKTRAIETTFPDGGNVLILSRDPGGITVREVPGISAAGDAYPRTKIVRLDRKTASPRFQTLLRPYKAGSRPNVAWVRYGPADDSLGEEFYSLKLNTNGALDWASFGRAGTPAEYKAGITRADADFAAVRLGKDGALREFSWANGRVLEFNGQVLAKADAVVPSLSVRRCGSEVIVDASGLTSSVAVRVAGASRVIVNGRVLKTAPAADEMITIPEPTAK